MNKLYIFTIVLLLTGCATQQKSTSTMVSCDYDARKNQTNYMVFPYGSVSIEGKWEKTNYNSSAKQQFFRNSDSVTIAIAFALINKFEFNLDNSKKGFDFVQAYYQWDADYFIKSIGLKQEKIEENPTENYIIWRVFGNYNNSDWNTYFLFGCREVVAHNYSVNLTKKWSKEQIIDFLKKTYLVK